MIKTLYVKLTPHPIFEVMGILSTGPEHVILLVPSNVHLNYDPNYLLTSIRKRSRATLLLQTIDFSNFDTVQKLLSGIHDQDGFLLSSMDTLEDLILFRKLSENHKNIFFIESDGDLWHLQDSKVENIATEELQLEDFFESIGGHIIHDEKKFYVHESYGTILSWIGQNYETWSKVKHILRRPNLTKSVSESASISVQNWVSESADKRAFQLWLDFLHSQNIIHIKRTSAKIIIHFSHHHFKEYFMKFGMWFEHMIYTLIKENQLLENLNTGVLFSWDTKQNLVKNELDVVGISGNRLVIISCKDTANISEHSLNEIALYTGELAEDSSLKIIATTMPLNQAHLIARAEALGIHLLHYNGDGDAFIQALKRLL
ncbi:Card1-like endonuclease domain-containing protein [Fusibacter sp. 3D3]|uniref:Card1-like endonuclease domain-containing protein n=1 Tax=Fusibacter sp. 3D3 TaxID=1048380 RepID=UPI0008531C7F|nr:DUF1887 family CARF protein [Fusibacter sp. 3D3]GAU76050.1 conserved hypothetical protein [Fusibacter sp. 3D3]